MSRRLVMGLWKQVQALGTDDKKSINKSQRNGWRKQLIERSGKIQIQSCKNKPKDLFTMNIHLSYASGHKVETKKYLMRRVFRKIPVRELWRKFYCYYCYLPVSSSHACGFLLIFLFLFQEKSEIDLFLRREQSTPLHIFLMKNQKLLGK